MKKNLKLRREQQYNKKSLEKNKLTKRNITDKRRIYNLLLKNFVDYYLLKYIEKSVFYRSSNRIGSPSQISSQGNISWSSSKFNCGSVVVLFSVGTL